MTRPFDPTDLSYREHLQGIAQADVTRLLKKDAEYGASWKKRAGPGAYMNVARKMDRVETMVSASRNYDGRLAEKPGHQVMAGKYDVFAHIEGDVQTGTDEGLLDSIRDLRGYLLLVEADLVARGVVTDYDEPVIGVPAQVETGSVERV